MVRDYEGMERRWQSKWEERGLGRADRDEGRPKFMIIFAYPGVTGFLHVGHLRGYTYADAIGRYKRMEGFNVMFPVGTHATGNGAISLAARVSRGDEGFIDYLVRNGCPEDRLGELKDPAGAVEFFNSVYVEDYWKRFGFLADWRRFTSTVRPDYGKFIQWQFRKLSEAGLLIQKPYFSAVCPHCGPVAVDASETDISKGGGAETQEYTLLKFKRGGEFLVAATLRPETVYGQVCFWVNPDVTYSKIKKGGEVWIVSPEAERKLMLQKDGVERVGQIPGRDMVGWMCEAPMIRREIPVLPAAFCDPDVGTGLVTSVPSDAPDDWMSLAAAKAGAADSYGLPQELLDSIVPIPIISIEGYGEFPARDAVERMGITGPGDPRLDEAKKQVYKDGYHMGRMRETCGPFSGMRVEEAKDKMRQAMIDSGEAELFYDLTEEVVCRCGERVFIKRIDDQWFVDYGNAELTERTREHSRSMDIMPPEYRENVRGVLGWFRERACVRQGNWLGTRFPFDEKWIIEAISDSTLYPLYYIISIYANDGRISPENMGEEFFDYVVLSRGTLAEAAAATGADAGVLEDVRRDVGYWYPLDVNLGGKEHMTVHFPVFLFNHRAILPDSMQPRGILVNWYVTGKKDKISKSKGGAQPIRGAVREYGADGMRLYYAHVASMFVDVEWSGEAVEMYGQRLERVMSTIEEALSADRESPEGLDRWLASAFASRLEGFRKAMDRYDLRQASTIAYFEMLNDMRWYLRRGGGSRAAARDAARTWILCMAPVTPHSAEELWAAAGFEGLASESRLPPAGERDGAAEYGEELLKGLISDVAQIRKVAGSGAGRIIVYTAPSWKREVLRIAAGMGSVDIPSLTKACMADEGLRRNGKAVSEFVKKVAPEISRSVIDAGAASSLDEAALLRSAAGFLSAELGAEVTVLSADGPDLYDPAGKSRAASPGRPAILLE
ncbi:MAG: leucine--tRNA ligase [Candidatus Methanoplasma sp.]|jgi:leucyl-tRNA synthetase|nr:leucine--tRNA ligase [Candidatus Methanoplasma sp.]